MPAAKPAATKTLKVVVGVAADVQTDISEWMAGGRVVRHRLDAWPPASPSPSGSARSRGGPSNSESLSSCHADVMSSDWRTPC